MSFNDKQQGSGFDYKLTKHFVDYIGVKLRINVYLNINQLFNNLENPNSDLLLKGLFIMRIALIKHRLAMSTIPFPRN